MSEQVNYQELEQLVSDQSRVHDAAFYRDARPRTQKIYDQTIQMGQDILADRDEAQPSPQTMVDMVVQSINTAIKALKSNPVLSASAPKLPKPNSVRSEVRPAEAVASTSSDQSSTASSAPASAHEQPTQTTAAESGQLKVDAHATTNSTADPAPATAPTTPQPTEVTQPTAAGETHSDQLGTQATAAPSAGSESVAAESATPDTAASQETAAAATGSTASEKSASAASELTTAEKAADSAATAMSSTPASDAAPASQTAGTEKKDPSTNKKRNLPMVVRQKPNWHLLPQAIWRGLQWTLGSKTVLKTK